MTEERVAELRRHRVWASKLAYRTAFHTIKSTIENYSEENPHPDIQEVLDDLLTMMMAHFHGLEDLLPGVHQIEEVPRDPPQARL